MRCTSLENPQVGELSFRFLVWWARTLQFSLRLKYISLYAGYRPSLRFGRYLEVQPLLVLLAILIRTM